MGLVTVPLVVLTLFLVALPSMTRPSVQCTWRPRMWGAPYIAPLYSALCGLLLLLVMFLIRAVLIHAAPLRFQHHFVFFPPYSTALLVARTTLPLASLL